MPKSRRKETVKLRKAELARLIDFSPAVHFVAKASGDYGATYISSGIKAQLGYEPAQFTGDSEFWASHVHPNDQPAIFANLKQLFENDQHVHEYRFLHADGSYRWMHDSLTLIRDKDGNPLEIVGSWLDITERKGFEEQLRQSEARLKEAQRIAKVGYWNWDVINNEASYSDEMIRIFGEDPKTPKRTYESFMEGVHPEDRQGVTDALERALADRNRFVVDYRIVLPDGSEKFIYSQGEVAFDREGRAVSMAGTIQDITEHRRLEAQLHQAQKMEAVGQLTGGMAHNFNNLLAVIVGRLDFLKETGSLDAMSAESVQAALDAALRGAKLVDRLMVFSRIQRLVPEDLNINDVVKELKPLLKDTLGEDIEIRTRLAGDLFRTSIDKNQLENSFINLALNARDAMPAGGILTIETYNVELAETDVVDEEEVMGGGYVVLAVSDIGAGIPKDVKPHIFEPFFSTKGVGEGSGLGLSMVHGFVKQSKGHIDVYSDPGHGTTIKIYLPQLGYTSEDTAETIASRERLPAGDETILLVEDEMVVRETAAMLLRSLGYRVLEACDGSNAMELLTTTDVDVDLLFTDIVMPGALNGVELANQARRLQPNLKVLYTTGYTLSDHSINGLAPGNNDVVTKPYRIAKLALTIRAVLDRE